MTHPGPSHPGPTGPTQPAPPRGNGHALPPLAPGSVDAAPYPPADPGTNPLPQEIDQVHTAIRKLVQAHNDLVRIADPLSAPDDDTFVRQELAAQAAGHIGWAVGYLSELAARFPNRPANPTPPGRPTPGSAAAAATAVRESPRGLVAPRVAGASSDPRPRRATDAPAGNGVRPGVGS